MKSIYGVERLQLYIIYISYIMLHKYLFINMLYTYE